MAERGAVPQRRVAFLRGVNVGGHRGLRMADLRLLATRLGLRDVSTLGASGNLLYASLQPAAVDQEALEVALARRLGRATVVLRDPRQMADLVRHSPFARPGPALRRVPEKWRFVALLRQESRKALPALPPGVPLAFAGRTRREVFYAMREPTWAAVAMADRLDRALGSPVTVRNWAVVQEVVRRLAAPPAASTSVI